MNKFFEKLTIEQYGKIRFLKEFIFQKKAEVSITEEKKRVWFLDAPDYANLGDQAIAYAIHNFCEIVLPNTEIVEFQEKSVLSYLSWLKKNVKSKDIIVLQGGGNLGNLYPRFEFVRRMIVKSFNDNKIIIFPQSVFFSNDRAGKHEAWISRKIYGKSKNLILFARDSVSYEEMKKKFPETHIELCPDIVFSLNGLIKSNVRNGLGICMRDDKEKTISDEQIANIVKLVKIIKEKRFDTVVEVKCSVIGKYREILLLNKLKEFAECEMLITDRLHGMIFSYITSTPCIAIGNRTGKSYYAYNDWLFLSENIFFIQEPFDTIIVPKNTNSKNLDFSRLKKALLLEIGE